MPGKVVGAKLLIRINAKIHQIADPFPDEVLILLCEASDTDAMYAGRKHN